MQFKTFGWYNKKETPQKLTGLLIRLHVIQTLTSALVVHAALQNKKNSTCARIGRTKHNMIMGKFDRRHFLIDVHDLTTKAGYSYTQ